MPDPSKRTPPPRSGKNAPPADELEQLFADALAATEERGKKGGRPAAKTPPKGPVGRVAAVEDEEASMRIDIDDTLGLGNGLSAFDDLDRELEAALKDDGEAEDLDAEVEKLLTASLAGEVKGGTVASVAPEIGDDEILAFGDDGAIPLSAAKDMEIERLRSQVGELSRGLSLAELELRTAEDRVQTLEAQVVAATRSQANASREFDAFRRRVEREREDANRHAGEKVIKEFLGVFDNLERALHHAGKDRHSALGQGIDMTLGQLGIALKRNGVERVEARPGAPFDPTIHEAMGQDWSDSVPSGAVVREMQAGFSLHGRLLRATVVLVSRGPRPSSNPSSPALPAMLDPEDRATDGFPAVPGLTAKVESGGDA